MNCALCHHDASATVSTQDAKSSGKLLVAMCKQCGLVQQSPIPSIDELKVYYSHNYRLDYKSAYSPKPKHVYRAGLTAIRRIRFLRNNGIENGTLLDVGAGGGEFVRLSGALGFTSQGIEPNIGYSEYAANEYGCDVKTSELTDAAGSYDIITMFHVLEHLPSPLKTFEALYRLLNEDGFMLIEVPWIETTDASPHNIYFKAHIFYFSIDTLTACASQYFKVIKVDTNFNLKILFKAKASPSSTIFPSKESVDSLEKRLAAKGWAEYLFKGKGLLKSIRRMIRFYGERKVNGLSGKDIMNQLIAECSQQ